MSDAVFDQLRLKAELYYAMHEDEDAIYAKLEADYEAYREKFKTQGE